ncbi:3-hydroxy-3-methylglutaryl-coenzyme A reductase [Smittium mucronatum]|uniref:3-hydroxy-3-methylglutaryl coenzyme A reductase n=1 Tax=Smittium mucronatum TaxID=133383 RepID=A0A1R0H5C6_9FUNG|nr:3-hydroxy-3-methylglutaryl-coenzyme A reductase [Smittium mucronatum]
MSALRKVFRFPIRNPIESIAFVLVVISIPLYWLWTSIKDEDVFRRPNLKFPGTSFTYIIENGEANLLQTDLSANFNSDYEASSSSAELYTIIFRTHGAFDSRGILRKQYIQKVQSFVDEISNNSLDSFPNGEKISSKNINQILDTKVVLSPFHSPAIPEDRVSTYLDPELSYLFLDKRTNPSGGVTGAQAAVIAVYLNTTTSSQKAAAHSWWKQVSSQAPDFTFDYSKSTGKSKENISSRLIKDRSSLPLVAVISQNFLWRISDMLKQANPSEISLVLFTYSIMFIFLIQLFSTMNGLGSKYSLGITVVVTQVAAVLLAFFSFKAFGLKIESVILSESLPFLFISHGFDKHIILAKSTILSFVQNFKKSNSSKKSRNIILMDQNEIMESGIKSCLPSLLKGYGIEFTILLAGCASGIQSVRIVCLFSIFILFFDAVFMFTTYISILTLKVNLMQTRISALKKPSARSDALKSINYKTLISEASSKDSKLISRIKFLAIFAFLLMNFMDLKLSFAPSASKSSNNLPAKAFSFESTGYLQYDSLIKPLVLNISQSSPKDSSLHLFINVPTEYVVDPTKVSDGVVSSQLDKSTFSFNAGLFKSSINSVQLSALLVISILLNIYFAFSKEPSKQKVNRSKRNPILNSLGLKKIGRSLIYPKMSLASNINTSSSNTDDSNTEESDPAKVVDLIPNNDIVQNEQPKIVVAGELSEKFEKVIYTFDENGKLDNASAASLKLKLDLLNNNGPEGLLDQEIVDLVIHGFVQQYALEGKLNDPTRAVKIRRLVTFGKITGDLDSMNSLPYESYDYSSVIGQCCENVIGYLPIPVGVAGPLLINDESLFIPMATTEGALIASTSRGCKAISLGGGVSSFLVNDGMTRGPCLEMSNLRSAYELKTWADSEEGFQELKQSFESTSRFAKLLSVKTTLAGRMCFIRFKTFTGDAMGMNMISKGTENALRLILSTFEGSKVISISGNYCTDKKPASINWIDGRGKSIVAEAVIPESVVSSVLKTSISKLVEVNTKKNLVGSAMAGAMGGFNAHASNILTAIFLATGQDPAQNVESSMCLTFMEQKGDDLVVSVTMPCIEVGTIGGGTGLKPQQSCLSMLGCLGPNYDAPGSNAQRLAKIIAGTVMAGELSLLAALCTGDLVKSHIALNRKAN